MNMGLTYFRFHRNSRCLCKILCVPFVALLDDGEVDIIRALFQQFTRWIGECVCGVVILNKETLQPNNSISKNHKYV